MKQTTIVFLFFLFLAPAGKLAAQLRFNNPILAGFYPDPSICRVGHDYYLVNSSFAYYPGLPVFHSTDLVHWQQLGCAMNRPDQLDLAGAGVTRGLFAPTIRYHNGTFYIICTLIDKGGNFIITAKDPAGPWSNPTWLPDAKGIDPSLFFDDNDKAYLVYNSEAPGNKPLYNGHRTIRMYAFDMATLHTTGEEKILVNGGTDISKKPVWIEGPHIYKKDGYYYLVCAEGGTGYNHSEVVFRSRNADGPYESYRGNPILTQRQLDPGRPNPITSTGHADLVDDGKGNWYAVFLGCRPYEGDYYNTGRETFMAPVAWEAGWPLINPGKETVQYTYSIPGSGDSGKPAFSGNYYFRDAFYSAPLSARFVFLRTVTRPWYAFNHMPGGLTLQLQAATCADKKENPSFIGFRQAHLKGYAATSVVFTASTPDEKAGLLVFQDEMHYYYLCRSADSSGQVVQLLKSNPGGGDLQLLASSPTLSKTMRLKIVAKGNTYSFYYGSENSDWQLLKEGVDAKFLSTATAGGFVGCLYAIYATGSGKNSFNKARFNWFEYRGSDDVYKH